MSNRGQALAELLIAIPLLGALLVWAVPFVLSALNEKGQARQIAQLALAQAQLRKHEGMMHLDPAVITKEFDFRFPAARQLTLNSGSDYPFATAMRPVEFLTRNALAMASDNLWEVSITEGESPWIHYYRLADDWSPARHNALQTRPAALLGTTLFNNSLMHTVQSVFGSLPVARELASDQLIFGHIDDQVVPAGYCAGQEEQC